MMSKTGKAAGTTPAERLFVALVLEGMRRAHRAARRVERDHPGWEVKDINLEDPEGDLAPADPTELPFVRFVLAVPDYGEGVAVVECLSAPAAAMARSLERAGGADPPAVECPGAPAPAPPGPPSDAPWAVPVVLGRRKEDGGAPR